jgi:hypothetical protein
MTRVLEFRPRDKPLRGMLARGVWTAPYFGPNGETVLVAVDSQQRLVGSPRIIGDGESRIAAADSLLDELDRADPIAG